MRIITDIVEIIETEEFDKCQIEKLKITDSLLIEKYFFSSVFIDCDLSDCDVNKSTFRDCEFINCNLSLMRFCDVNLIDVVFRSCKLIGIDWTSIVWTKRHTKRRVKFPVSFYNSTLNYSIFIGLDMYSVSFIDSILKEVEFEDTNLECANFENSDLSESHFKNTNLKKADFSSAKNYSINGTTNSIKGAKFSFPEVISLIHGLEVVIV